ncbi:hypothetical protein A9Q86_01830 [Flavobacteriales bacterium 33_180_T64]|nr:hypothetical protein A9Q86_01830 [Flavobacteriales bacterium 33_180_T64]
MINFSLENILSIFTDSNTESINECNYLNLINQYVDLAKPDFLAVLNVKSSVPIIFQKNYNLKFPLGKEGTVQDIFDGIDESTKEKILEADTKVVNFAFKNNLQPITCTYYMRFNSELSLHKKSALLRNVTVLTTDKENKPHLVLACVFDVSHLNGSQDITQIDIKNYIDCKNCLTPELEALKKELVSIFSSKMHLTKREEQILKLISEGNTSAQIAENLKIAVTTVNTHRQNLIKKNNVSNTSALLNTI